MNPIEKDEGRAQDATYKNVMALYAAIKNDSHNVRVKDSIDFCCDVELKARRALDSVDFQQFYAVISRDPDNFENVPKVIRRILGKEFHKSKLDVQGAYRKLYFVIKNNS